MEVDTGSMPLMKEKRVRESDIGQPIKITRELPLWGILTAVFTLITTGFGLYYQVRQSNEIQLDQAINLKDLSKKIDQIQIDLARKDGQTSQFDYRITSNERRLNIIESQKSSK